MKNWPSQYLPVVILAILAAATFVAREAAIFGYLQPAAPPRHDPDAIAENFIVERFDENGLLKYRLTAPYMEHYPDDDSSMIRLPVMVNFRQNASPITATSNFADVTSKGEIVTLRENVRIVRAGDDNHPEMIATMPDLTVRPNDGTAETASPVRMTQGDTWVTGVGMQLDNNASTLVLLSQVRGEYIRTKPTP